jgi:signal transduction histidine kinase/CheY-like chemotaxis protein/HPt (histidine-containing phosphotransfer) domain-containing protein
MSAESSPEEKRSELLVRILEQLGDGVLALDERGRTLYANPTAREQVSLPAAPEGMSERLERIRLLRPDRRTPIPPDELPLARSLHGDNTDGVVTFVPGAAGRPARYIGVTSRPLRRLDGTLDGAVAVLRDVSEAFRNQQEINLLEALERSLDEAAQRRLSYDRTLERVTEITGWPLAELWMASPGSEQLQLAGHAFRSDAAPGSPEAESVARWSEDRRRTRIARGQGLAGRVWDRGELEFERVEEALAPSVPPEVSRSLGLQARIGLPIRNQDGIAAIAVVGLSDATEFDLHLRESLRRIGQRLDAFARRVATGRALELARREADRANQAKGLFLAHMSHEIRTPLNAVVGLSELLEGEPLGPSAAEYARLIRSASETLTALIGEILDLSKIESGHLELEQREFDLPGLLESALDILTTGAHAKQLSLSYRLAPELPCTVLGDSTRLRQILVNLLGNAIKFTAEGEVHLEVGGGASGEGAIGLRFEVRDTGPGISTEARSRLFRPFEQADSSITRRFGGTGLGLSVSKSLAELMGGEMWLESSSASGSVFAFTVLLPSVAGERSTYPHGAQPGLAGRSFLLSVGARGTLEQLESWLTDWGAKPGKGSPDVAGGQDSPSAIVVEAAPGWEMTESWAQGVRTRAGASSAVPLLAIVSRLDPRPPKEVLPSGVRLLRAPLRARETLNEVRASLGLTVEPSPSSPAPKTELLAERLPLRVLLVEDNPVNQRVAVFLFGRLGYRIDTVDNGRAALDQIHAAPYDLVFMDIEMPEMDGLTATRALRAEPPFAESPWIVATSAFGSHTHQARCLEAGMNDSLPKPLRLGDLREALLRSGPAKSRGPNSPRVRGGQGSQEEEGESVLAPTDFAGTPIESEIRAMFAQESARTLEVLRRSASEGSTEGVRKAAHALGSSSAQIGALRLSARVRKIERLATAGDLDGIREGLPRLEAAWFEVRSEIESPAQARASAAVELREG